MSVNVRQIESIIDINNRLYFALNQIRTNGGTMETIPGHDEWKTEEPQESLTDADITIIERNLKPCPFCLKRPCFENSDDQWFVSCACGAQMPGEDAVEASAKWSTRPTVGKLREGERSAWAGW